MWGTMVVAIVELTAFSHQAMRGAAAAYRHCASLLYRGLHPRCAGLGLDLGPTLGTMTVYNLGVYMASRLW